MKKGTSFLFLILFLATCLFAQVDTSSRSPITYASPSAQREMKTTLGRSLILPGILIAYGITTIKTNGLYSSYQAKKDIQKSVGSYRNSIDNYLIYAPYVELMTLNLLKYKCKNDRINTSLLILKSATIMTAIVFPVKYLTHVLRPDSSDFQSFPSGHTAAAFMAASIVHREYRSRSPWPGVFAYVLAGSVGAFRMINNKHWEADVIVGAGVGILSSHLAYATHQYKWGRREICASPSYQGGYKTLSLSMAF